MKIVLEGFFVVVVVFYRFEIKAVKLETHMPKRTYTNHGTWELKPHQSLFSVCFTISVRIDRK